MYYIVYVPIFAMYVMKWECSIGCLTPLAVDRFGCGDEAEL